MCCVLNLTCICSIHLLDVSLLCFIVLDFVIVVYSGHVLFNSNIFVTCVMSLLVRPHRVDLVILTSLDIVITRLVVGVGLRMTQVVAGVGRLTVHVDVHGDVLSVRRTTYPILLVVHLSM